MSVGLKPDCFACQHFLGLGPEGWSCGAFAAIPVDVLSSRRKHTAAIDGDGGVRFEAKKTQAAASYEPVTRHLPEKCAFCNKYQRPGGCREVEGPISTEGWCPGFDRLTEVRVDAAPKVHLVLKGNALCDFQRREGSRAAAHSVKEFDQIPKEEQCKECAKKLARFRLSRSDSEVSEEPLTAAGVMIVTDAGKVLLLDRSDGTGWAFPGGTVEPGETAEEAAIRECEEETGHKPTIRGEWTRRIADGVDFTTFLASVPEEFEPRLNHEHDAHCWLPVDDLATASLGRLGLE